MRSVKNRILFGGLAALLACSGQVTFAKDGADETGAGKITPDFDTPAPPDETKGASDRGVTITPFSLKPVNPIKVTPTVIPTKQNTPRTIGNSSTLIKPVTHKQPIKSVVVVRKPVIKTNNQIGVKPVVPILPNVQQPQNDGGGTQLVSQKSSFINAWLDRPGANPKYKVGDKMVVNVSSTADCNVVVYNYDAQKNLTQIFPNDHQKDGKLKAGQRIQIGGDESPFEYSVSGNGGVERIFVYAYPTSQSHAPLTVALAPGKQSPFRSANNVSMDDYVAMVRDSAVFTTRGIEVIPKKTVSKVSAKSAEALDPNKLELTFQVDSK